MYSRAYLRHLFHAQELLAMQIASIHNLAFYLWLAGEARKPVSYTHLDVRKYLGTPEYSRDKYQGNEYAGVVTGLA